MADSYRRTTCRMCDGDQLQTVLSLTATPPGNRFLKGDELEMPEPKYPLDLNFCHECHHVQLGDVVDPRILYQNSYSYVSGTSSTFLAHLEHYATEMVARYRLRRGQLVADIGSNDGSCLRFFKKAGLTVIGVDPAIEIARRATESGIETIGTFFSKELAATLRRRYGPAALITSHNTCAHIDDLEGVFRGVETWLANDGVFVFEVGYFLDVVENLWFDTIYHEHLDYHTVAPFGPLLTRCGLEPLAVQRVSPQGGSIRVFVQRSGGPHRIDASIREMVALEAAKGLDQPELLREFGRRIVLVGDAFRSLIDRLKANGSSIAGYGAPTKATTLMAQFGVGGAEIDFVVDDNPLKQGLFTPASHIVVTDSKALYERKPDYLLLLAWNFAEPIMAAHQDYRHSGGRFIVPLPYPRIVDS